MHSQLKHLRLHLAQNVHAKKHTHTHAAPKGHSIQLDLKGDASKSPRDATWTRRGVPESLFAARASLVPTCVGSM